MMAIDLVKRRIAGALVLLLVSCTLATLAVMRAPHMESDFLPYPPGKECAIAIIDDTDFFQFETTAPVYDLIDSLGLHVTKTVWIMDAPDRAPAKVGLSLADPAYREWVLRARSRGHEITLHSATSGDDERATTLAAYDSIRTLFGSYPRLDVFHSNNREALYWGSKRLPSRLLGALYRARMPGRFEGDEPGSRYFWLDRSRDLVRYVRTYTFSELNTWAVNPSMPYEDSRTPGAPLWFASSNGRTAREFVRLLAPANMARLKAEGGVSIVYTHFGLRFTEPSGDGAHHLSGDVHETLLRCGRDPAIEFVPAGDLLDRLRLIQPIRDDIQRGDHVLRLPAELRDALASVSTRPPHGGTRVPADEWLRQHGYQVEWVPMPVHDEARRIPGRERWRLVLRWLTTQIGSPT